MLKEKLINIGLSETEVKIIIFLLNNPRANIAEVARHLDVTHPSAREQLEKLVNRGLLNKKREGKTQLYFFSGRQVVKKMVINETKNIIAKQKEMLRIAAELDSLISSKLTLDEEAKTSIYFLKGPEGISRLTDTISKSKNKLVYEFVDRDLVIYKSPSKSTKTIDKYSKSHIRFEVVYTADKDVKMNLVTGADAVYLDRKYTKSPTAHILVFDDKVALSFVTDDRAIILIENKWVANAMETILSRLKQLEKTSKKTT